MTADPASRGARLPDRDPTSAPLRARAVPVAGLALLWLLVIDIPDHVEIRRFSGGAVLTVITALVCLVTLIAHAFARPLPDPTREPRLVSPTRRVPMALVLFGIWATVSAAVHTSTAGAQNVLVYDTFVGAVIACASFTSIGSADRFSARVSRVGWLVAGLYLLSVSRHGLGADTVYGARSVALVGLVILAVAVSRRNRLLALVTVFTVGASLSRTATVVAIAVLCLGLALTAQRHTARLTRIAAWSIAGLVAAALAVTKVAPLHDRFLGGDNALRYHGIDYNTSGRTELWAYVWRLAHEHLLFGGGAGNAQNAVTEQFGSAISHPHNDYLRLLNDFGVVGLGLFLVALLAMLRGTWVRGRRTRAPIHWAAFLGLLGVALAAVTDNALVYPFVMTPLGVIVGLSLAHPVPDPEKHAEPDRRNRSDASTAPAQG